MDMADKRDFREETALNAAEFVLLKSLTGKLGLSKAAVLRYALHFLGDHVIKNEQLKDTGLLTED